MKKPLSNLNLWKTAHRAIPLMLFLLLTSSFIAAQTRVSGVVSDENGLTLPGANVMLSGSDKSVTTDINGKYEINAPADGILSFSFIGFNTIKILIKGKSKIDVKLKSDAQNLDEVVVIGYGTQKRGDVNGAVSSIKAKDLDDIPQVSVDQLLQGRAAGVVVTSNSGQPGSNVSVKIRGASSLGGSNEPLYIIDGIAISGDSNNNASSGRPISAAYSGANAPSVTVSPLSLINPNDIESIDILKDASATAIYGSRAANGVVIVTTKQGKKGTGKLSYDSFLSIQNVTKFLPTMNLQQYATQQNALTTVFGNTPRPEFVNPSLLGNGTDWQREVFKTALMKSHQVSYSGGNDSSNYYISGGFVDQEGTVIGSAYKRYNFKTNVNSTVKSWLKVGTNIAVGLSDEKLTLNGNTSGIISTALFAAPDVAVRNFDGTYSGPPVGGNPSGDFINPIAQALINTNTLNRKNFSGNFYSEFKLFKGLEYRIDLSASTEFTEGEEFRPTYVWGSRRNDISNYLERKQDWYSTNIKNILTYKNSFGKNNFNVLLGHEANDGHWKGNSYSISGLASNELPSIDNGDLKTIGVSNYKGSSALLSYFSRLIYDYDNKYGLSASYRADGSSKFDTGHKWGFFPSVALSWKLSNEPFMEGTREYIDNIKFRAGYGETGSQETSGGQYTSNIQNMAVVGGISYLADNIANPNVTWETSVQKNIGIDFTMFNSALSGTVDVYQKVSKGFLFPLPLPGIITGWPGQSYRGAINSPIANLGSMENKGIDVSLAYSKKFNDSFNWNSTVIFSKYKNKLLEMQDNVVLSASADLTDNDSRVVTNTFVGGAIGQFYGFESLGIYRTADAAAAGPKVRLGNSDISSVAGDVIYKDINNDGVISDADKTQIGNPNPDFTFSWNNTFKYKNLDLGIFVSGVQGNKIMNLTRRYGTLNGSLYKNQLVDAGDFYSATNTNASLPRPTNLDKSDPNTYISSRYVEDGSYIRIQNVTFGYSFPSDLTSKLKISKIRLYSGIQNLYTFTKYTGYDPEVGSLNQNVRLSGIDNGRYPSPRTFTFGLNVEF